MENVWKAVGLVLAVGVLAGVLFYQLNVPVVHQTLDGQVQYVEVLDVWRWQTVKEPASWLKNYHGHRDVVTGPTEAILEAMREVKAGRIPRAN